MRHHVLLLAVASAVFGAAAPARGQTTQVVKPPQSQAWIDVATYSGFGMPGAGMGGAGVGHPMAALGSLFGGGGGGQKNSFGRTQSGQAGRWVDVTLYTRANPQLAEALQNVPAGFLAPPLKLQAPRATAGAKPPPEPDEERVDEPEVERPKGRLLMYWGCGATIRAGQPKVLDMASLSPADLQRFFVSRRATQRGAHSAPGRPVWPQPDDARMVPAGASLVGEHAFSGAGVPEGFRFQIPPQQDLMPALRLQQHTDGSGATELRWDALPTARAYFIAAMGGAGTGRQDAVFWTSSEQPDTGFGLMDYQTNPAVDRWLKEKVLLAPDTTRCTVPKGVFPGEGAMLRMIAYGSELNLAYPPRPTDPKVAWEPQWAVKLRVKSMTGAMLGTAEMPGMGGLGADTPEEAPPAASEPAKEKKPKALDLLKGILGR